MDSLLASYASSDEEEQTPQQRIPPAKPGKSELKAEEKFEGFLPKPTSKRGGFFDSLPPPKSSLFNSLPPPKSQSFPIPKPQSENDRTKEVDERAGQIAGNSKSKSSSSSLFTSLPQPKSSAAKRVVQFRPPTITNPHAGNLDDEDEDSDEGEAERKRKRSRESISTSSAASFLSSIPAPRHSATLGALPSGSGMSRRSVIETEAPSSNVSTPNATGTDAFVSPNVGYSNDQSIDTNQAYSSWGSESESYAYYSHDGAVPNANVGSSSFSTGSDDGVSSDVRHLGDQSHENLSASLGGESYAYYDAYNAGSTDVNGSYANYGDYGNYTQHENNWENSGASVSGVVENAFPVHVKRGRKDIPPEIVEVNQDELMKNRPREDHVKSTGIAFGPAYQPVSTKGKPTKLHKRKHQIGSLYFDMRQKETELAERRSKGFLTKAQTQAKYGW